MFANVVLKTLRDQRRGLVGWGIGIAGLVIGMGAVWPMMRAMPDLEKFFANYPKGMRDLFNIDAMITGSGFFNAELFSLMLPILFLAFAIRRGARLVAGEEQAGTLDTLLATPLSRIRVLLDKAAALGIAVCLLGLVCLVATTVASALFGMRIPAGEIAGASASMALLGLLHGWLALAVGAATGRRSLALGASGAVAAGGYVLYALSKLVEGMRGWAAVSPFQLAIGHGPLGGSLPLGYLWLAVASLLVLALSTPLFHRRDISLGTAYITGNA
jgi:ABC-2 type transport system permease protein